MKNFIKNLSFLTLVAFVILVSCSKEDENKINIDQYTGYYNLKDAYNDDLLLKVANSKETASYYGSTNGSSIDVLASLYKDNSSGRRTIYKVNTTADTSIVYNFDRPELGGILFIKKGSLTYVQEFKFQEDKKSIKPTFYLSKITEINKITNKRLAQKTGVTTIASGDIIDKGIGYFLDDLEKILPKEVIDKIKKDSEDSSSSSKDNNKGLLDGLLNILKNIEDYQNEKELGNIIEKLMAEDPNPTQDQLYPPKKNPYVDCALVPNGKAIYDECQRCVLGNTGLDYCHCETSGLELSVSYKAYSATLTPSGGSGSYEFFWGHNQSAEAIASNLTPGKFYPATVTDLKTSCSKTVVVIVKGCDLPNSTLAITTSTTSNSATANPIGGQAPYKFLWSNGSEEKTATNLMSGIYTVTVTDDFGCSITSTVNIGCANSTLTAITSVTANSATAIVTGGLAPYTYLWSNGARTQTVTNLPAGKYNLEVKDALGCSIKTTDFIILDKVFVLTGVSFNDKRGIGTICPTNFDFSCIYDLKFSFKDNLIPTDGQIVIKILWDQAGDGVYEGNANGSFSISTQNNNPIVVFNGLECCWGAKTTKLKLQFKYVSAKGLEGTVLEAAIPR